MLVKLPTAFFSHRLLDDATLDAYSALAVRHRRLLTCVLWVTLGLQGLAFLPQLSGPGPMLAWACRQWPDVWCALHQLAQQPLSFQETLASLFVAGAFLAVWAVEMLDLTQFQSDLEPVCQSTSLYDAMRRLAGSSVEAAEYFQAVQSMRRLRVGDWSLMRKLAEVPRLK